MTAEQHLAVIEEILSEIERLNAETGGQFREPSDREAFDIAARIERQMRQRSTTAA